VPAIKGAGAFTLVAERDPPLGATYPMSAHRVYRFDPVFAKMRSKTRMDADYSDMQR